MIAQDVRLEVNDLGPVKQLFLVLLALVLLESFSSIGRFWAAFLNPLPCNRSLSDIKVSDSRVCPLLAALRAFIALRNLTAKTAKFNKSVKKIQSYTTQAKYNLPGLSLFKI